MLSPLSTQSSLSTGVDAAIEQALAEHRLIGAVVLVARHGKVIHRRAAGLASVLVVRPAALPLARTIKKNAMHREAKN